MELTTSANLKTAFMFIIIFVVGRTFQGLRRALGRDRTPLARASAAPLSERFCRVYGRSAVSRSWVIIQLMPNRSRNCANRVAKNVSCIGMNTSPPSESAEKIRSASVSL